MGAGEPLASPCATKRSADVRGALGALLALACCTSGLDAGNWPRFRGNNGSGLSPDRGIPTSWSPGDYAWNIRLPGVGHAAPIVWDDKLFVTSAIDEGAIRYLFCLDARTGKENWSRMTGLNRSHKHNKNSWASSTPTTDGKRVYVCFADELEPLIVNIHGEIKHVGKRPKRVHVSTDERTELIRLRRDMQDAVEREDYERASELRDQIQKFEQEKGDS